MSEVKSLVSNIRRGYTMSTPWEHDPNQPQFDIEIKVETNIKMWRSENSMLMSAPATSADAGEKEEEEDDDDDDDGSSRRDKLWDKIQKSSCNYKTLDHGTYIDFAREYRSAVRNCIIIEDDHEKILLHFLAYKLGKDYLEPKAVYLRLFIKLILEVAEDSDIAILSKQSGKQKLTCLHYAIERKKIDLVKFICDIADETALADAIEIPNERDQTCLHSAIYPINEPNFELIRVLAEKATPTTILKKRSRIDTSDEGEGNTPLHDLVNIRMCETLTRKCPIVHTICDKCRPKENPEDIAKREVDIYLKILKMMVKKCPAAMKARNEADQSPYLFHIATRLSTEATQEWKELEFSKDEDQNDSMKNDASPLPTVTIKSPVAAKHEDCISAPSDSTGIKTAGIRRNTLNRRNSDMEASTRLKHVAPGKEYSKQLATEVAKFLIELCLSQKDFTEFPSSELIFKASPLTNKTKVTHANLALEPILACVELGLVSRATPTPAFSHIHAGQETSTDLTAKMKARELRENTIVNFFTWLRDRGVKRIVKLVVNDDPYLPCKDATIKKCLAGFDIRYLDWDKEDLNTMSIYFEDSAPNLQELWVSWSGRNSTLLGWSNREYGLRALKQLQTLYLTTNPGRESDERDLQNIATFKVHLGHPSNKPNLFVRGPSDSDSKASCDSNSNRLGAPKEGNNWIEAIDKFIQSINRMRDMNKSTRASMDSMKPIRLAIIDDGVDLEELATTDYIHGGWYPDKMVPEHRSMNTWYISDENHGTEMAKLIQRACPFVSLYIAKLDTRRLVYTSVAGSAADAILKAIENGANIISMSWTIYETNSSDNENDLAKLKDAIETAAAKDILLYCACEDSGWYGWKKPFPASIGNPKIKLVGSAGTYGERSDYVNPDKVDYLFPGEIITAKGVCSGSSATTALAAGLAALILWCAELHR